ncbi:MAG TPA: hypothetical protein VM120_24045 [Bryobacteraceae bacterium]|nr:hypothetical protein [Bryobacteraceae bacterium]
MSTHVKLLGILHIVFGLCGLLFGLAMFALFGGIAGIVQTTDRSGDAWMAIPILGGIGLFILLITVILSLPGLIAGMGLLQRRSWARTLTIVLSALLLLHVPFGTILGVYGLWVLLSNAGEREFNPVRQDAIVPTAPDRPSTLV